MLLPLLCRIKSDFLEEAMIFQEKLLLLWMTKLPNWQNLQK
jgi:hypothetical protein